jgi:hypothetical protein
MGSPGISAWGGSRSVRGVQPDYSHAHVSEPALVELVAEAIRFQRRGHPVVRAVRIDLSGLRINRENNIAIALPELLRRSNQCRIRVRVLWHPDHLLTTDSY